MPLSFLTLAWCVILLTRRVRFRLYYDPMMAANPAMAAQLQVRNTTARGPLRVLSGPLRSSQGPLNVFSRLWAISC